jgi:hypothetical protein
MNGYQEMKKLRKRRQKMTMKVVGVELRTELLAKFVLFGVSIQTVMVSLARRSGQCTILFAGIYRK